MSQLELQNDEIESLFHIYDDEISILSEKSFEIQLKFGKNIAKFSCTFPCEYPMLSPIYSFSTPWIRGCIQQEISDHVETIVHKNIGDCMVYQIVEDVRSIIEKYSSDTCNAEPDKVTSNVKEIKTDVEVESIEIFHGEPFTLHKSTFIAHVARVQSAEEVARVRDNLLDNRKIAAATHNISAHRIRSEATKNKLLEGNDDDGENKASERLLHMLVMMEVENVYVVVTRWFGGIKLGPDRFKIIKDTAKKAIIDSKWFTLR